MIRRTFDWENRYQCSYVDIKSKILREALQEVMKDVKSVSLVEDQPSVSSLNSHEVNKSEANDV